MDITVVFPEARSTPSKKVAIEIAHNHSAAKIDGIYKVKFNKKGQDLIKLLYLCAGWKLSHVLIEGKEIPISDVLDVLTCEENSSCNGKCYLKYPDYIDLLDEIEKNITDEDFDSESVRETISNLDSFEEQSDGSFKINKEKLKKNIEGKYSLPKNVCEKFDIYKIFKQIDGLPDTVSIPESTDKGDEEFSYLGKTEQGKLIETAKLIAPIFAEIIAKELDKVVIANFGTEKNASTCAKKADALFSLQRYDESLKCYNRALELYPENSQLWNDKAFLLEIGFEDYEKAAEAYDKAFELNHNNVEALRRKGICYDSLGMKKEAIEAYEKAIELFEKKLKEFPNDKDAEENLRYTRDNLSGLKE